MAQLSASSSKQSRKDNEDRAITKDILPKKQTQKYKEPTKELHKLSSVPEFTVGQTQPDTTTADLAYPC